MRTCILLLLLLQCSCLLSQQNQSNHDTSSIEISNRLRDTIVIVQKAVDNSFAGTYEEILEKTNNQLSLWWNPYGVLIAILGVLFAVLAIIAGFVIYRQSKEHKELINKSLDDHRVALDKLIIEKNNQLRNLEIGLDNSILEYKRQLDNVGESNRKQLEEFIKRLEQQKTFIDSELNTYKHSGWKFKDIEELYAVTPSTNFYARIVTNTPDQGFTIYLQILTSDNKTVWLGFSGNKDADPVRNRSEFTQQYFINSSDCVVEENISAVFKNGFPESAAFPIQVKKIRLRGSDVDRREITFSFKIS